MLTRQLAPDRVSSTLLLADSTSSENLKQSALKYCKLYKEYIYKVSRATWLEINNKVRSENDQVFSILIKNV